MKKVTTIIITSAALAFAIPLYATDKPDVKSESQRQTGVAQQQTDKMQSGQLATADKLKGMEVVSQDGEKIGKINKVTVEKQSGEVQFVTFSKGGVLGMGGDEISVPLSAFAISGDQAKLTVDRSKLENVPRQTSGATDSDYLRNLETHYGVSSSGEKIIQGDTTGRAGQFGQDPTETGARGDTTGTEFGKNPTETGDRGNTTGTRQMGQNPTETGDRSNKTGTQQN